MRKIKIKNKELLIRILKTISWLDKCRWSTDNNYNFINFFRKDLTNGEKILTHWICYVTDRQMPFEKVWDKGGYIFSELVYEYYRDRNQTPKKILDMYYEEYNVDKRGKRRFRFKSQISDITFASRFITEDYQHILQTLKVLDKYKVTINGREYKRNIVAFILHFIQRFKEKDDLLMRVACALYLLTYDLKKKENASKILKILNDENGKFEEKLKEFKRNSTKGKKRLWCCIRDYKKGLYNKMFNDAIKEIVSDDSANEFLDIWNNLPMDQIELPGDVWNNSPIFRDNLFANVLDFNTIPKTWNMPKIVREIYNQLKNEEEIRDFYPEQFDVTFDFVPRMCSKKLCNICLFGKNGVDFICIPSKDKYCSVALLTCGYLVKCREKDCIIKEGISKGICKGRI